MDKRKSALFAACINIFSALTLLSVITYFKGLVKVEKKEFDLQTVTASDYTLEMKTGEQFIDKMILDIRENKFMEGESLGYRMKFWFIKLLEDRLVQLSGQDIYRIADVNFAYHNSWLIDSLRQRGSYIKEQDWKKLNELNREITERIHSYREEDGT